MAAQTYCALINPRTYGIESNDDFYIHSKAPFDTNNTHAVAAMINSLLSVKELERNLAPYYSSVAQAKFKASQSQFTSSSRPSASAAAIDLTPRKEQRYKQMEAELGRAKAVHNALLQENNVTKIDHIKWRPAGGDSKFWSQASSAN